MKHKVLSDVTRLKANRLNQWKNMNGIRCISFDQELAVKNYQVALMLSVMAAAPAFSREDSTPANAGAIGAEQAVFDFCSKVLPAREGNFDKQAKQLMAGLSRDAIDNLRESAAYLQGYKVLQSVLREFSGANAVASCQAIVN